MEGRSGVARRLAEMIAVIALATACGSTTNPVNPTSTSGTSTSGGPPTSATSQAQSSTGPTQSSTGPTQSSSGASSSAPSSSVPLLAQGYVPLFPFFELAGAQAWERSYRQGGHQPWHLDAGMTALAFAGGYLGFTEIDLVTARRSGSDGAHIGVGYRDPAGRPATAATVHLMRFGTDSAAPWEVVGTDDTTFTLDVPAYGSDAASPLRAGGLISGVDENITVTVRQLGAPRPLGRAGPLPAGGQSQPWSVQIIYAGARPGPLTVAASTGGHVRQVERFAVTGIRHA